MSDLTQLALRPRLFLADGFASEEEVGHVLALGGDPDAVEARGLETKRDETGFSFELPIAGDPVLEGLALRMQRALKMGDERQPTFRFRRYHPGEGHPPHLDNYRIGDTFLLVTAILYLDEPEAGGETVFPRAEPHPVAVRPKPGRLAAWISHRPDGQVEELSWHEGRGVEAGTKTTITAFMYRTLPWAARLIQGAPPEGAQPGPDGVVRV